MGTVLPFPSAVPGGQAEQVGFERSELKRIVDLYGRMVAAGLWTEARDEELRQKLGVEVNEAIAEAEKKPDPPRETLFEDVYSSPPWFLREEREEMLAVPKARRPGAAQ